MKNIWVPLSGAIAQQRNVETIANNVANANTPGFKKDTLAFKEHLTALDKGLEDIDLPNKEWKPEDFYRTYDAENAYVKVAGNYTIHDQGNLTPTGSPLDVALQGPGFFEVLTPNGVRYTRKGHFSLNRDGELVTDQGFRVLAPREGSRSPQERIIKLANGQLSINMQGELFINNNPAGKLSIAEFVDVHALRKEGNSLFINRREENIAANTPKTTVHQGFIEQSNVNVVSEMSSLINANRTFESIQKAIKTYDNIAGRAVNDLAKF